MVWNKKPKNLGVRIPTTAHASTKPGVTGRAPGISTITFSPSDFFGAAARCLHLHTINPTLATPESLIIAALVEQHVDDLSNDFAVLATADRFKDYAKSYFSGTVAAGLAYLMMIGDGYVWADHFENERNRGPGAGDLKAPRSPDYVFARAGQSDVALLESKGTRSAAWNTFNKAVEDGYVGQVEPHLGLPIGTSLATHGYSIGAWMTSPTKAEFNIHHTDLVLATAAPATGPSNVTSVIQGNYATALQLAHGVRLGSQIRAGRIDDEEVPFVEFSWLGRSWLTFQPGVLANAVLYRLDAGAGQYWDIPLRLPWAWPYAGRYFFAIDKLITERILNALSLGTDPGEVRLEIDRMPAELGIQSREFESTVFPDGLAVIRNDKLPVSWRNVLWQKKTRAFIKF